MGDIGYARILASLGENLHELMRYIEEYDPAKSRAGVADFAFGNPQDMPLDGLVEAIGAHARPRDKDWFAYKTVEPAATEAVRDAAPARHGIEVDPGDVFMTPGAFGALSVAIRTIVDPGDEVIFISPPWFFYGPMIELAGGVPVRVTLTEPGFDLDVDAIEAAITPRTRGIIVNTPHNPTGRIYPRAQLDALGRVLSDAAERNGRRLYLLSDEAYCRILFDGNEHISPASSYPDTMVLYTYGKTLLAPGERLGYIALPRSMPDRDALRAPIFLSQVLGGWQIPSNTMMRATRDLDALSIDIGALQARRDRLANALRDMGYDLTVPDATFYMMVRSPIADDMRFTRMLAEHDVLVGPGVIFEMPGYFRLSLTASDAMVERALPGFEAALKTARA